MVIHYFTLLALSKELRLRLSGAAITEAFTQQKNELLLSCLPPDTPSPITLSISVEPKHNYCYLRTAFLRAKKNTRNVFPALAGRIINDVAVVPLDRTLQFGFDRDFTLFIRLYNTADSNILLVDADGTVIETFKGNKNLKGTAYDRKALEFDHRTIDNVETFTRIILNDPSRLTIAAVRETLPMLGSLYAHELLHRSNIEETRRVMEVEPSQLVRIHHHVQALFNEAQAPHPAIYVAEDGARIFSVIPLSHLAGCVRESYSSVNEALRALIASSYRRVGFERMKNNLSKKMNAELGRARRSSEKMTYDLTNSNRAEEYALFGQLLMANLQTVQAGVKEIELADLDVPHNVHRIPLDRALTPVRNAEKYFEKSKKAKAARHEAQKRHQSVQARTSVIEKLLLHLDECRSKEEVKEFLAVHKEDLKRMNLIEAETEKERVPFRVFTVAGGYEVWVGKSSANNDLLTMKYARPQDLWFHVRGAGGSHTVLKVPGSKESVPREAIRQAAAIAVYYSKMRKAGSTPVAYCERKYVRKPKRAAEGSVTLERENVIFVQPGLPGPATP